MIFLDTNILVYAFSEDVRAPRARTFLRDATIGVQGLNEFTAVARSKLGMNWPEVRTSIEALLVLCQTPVTIELSDHFRAVDLCERHRLAVYDAVMIATALRAGATRFISEDMHHGLFVDGQLRIENPFKPA